MAFILETQIVTADELRAAVKDLPRGTQRTYEMAIKRIRGKEPYLAGLGMGALAWVYFSKRPLTVMELRQALSYQLFKSISGADLIEEDQIVATCAGLITFVSAKGARGREAVNCQFCGEYGHSIK